MASGAPTFETFDHTVSYEKINGQHPTYFGNSSPTSTKKPAEKRRDIFFVATSRLPESSSSSPPRLVSSESSSHPSDVRSLSPHLGRSPSSPLAQAASRPSSVPSSVQKLMDRHVLDLPVEGDDLDLPDLENSDFDPINIPLRKAPTSPMTGTTFSVSNITHQATVTVSNGKISATMNNKTYEITVENIEAGNKTDITSAIASNNKQHDQMLKLAEKVCEYLSKSGFLNNGKASITLDNANNSISEVSEGRTRYQGTHSKVAQHAEQLVRSYAERDIQEQRTALMRKVSLRDQFTADRILLINVPGDGNCGPLALYNQLYQMDSRKYPYGTGEGPGTDNPAKQQKMRNICANYLYNLSFATLLLNYHSDSLENTIFTNLQSERNSRRLLIDSNFNFPTLTAVMQNGETVTITEAQIRSILDKKDFNSLNKTEKSILLKYRALCYTQQTAFSMQFVSGDFWQVYANAQSDYNIAIISTAGTGGFPRISQLYLKSGKKPSDATSENTLFIECNGSHYQSLNRLENKDFMDELFADFKHRYSFKHPNENSLIETPILSTYPIGNPTFASPATPPVVTPTTTPSHSSPTSTKSTVTTTDPHHKKTKTSRSTTTSSKSLDRRSRKKHHHLISTSATSSRYSTKSSRKPDSDYSIPKDIVWE